jgi:hypothetical protein
MADRHKIRWWDRFRAAYQDLIFRSIIVATLSIFLAIVMFNNPTPIAGSGLNKIAEYAFMADHYQPSYWDKLLDPLVFLTLALVVSTILLWLSTQRLAKTSSDALISLERPWVLIKLNPGIKRPGTRPQSWWHLELEICNHGRMPAVVDRVKSGWTQGTESAAASTDLLHALVLGPSDKASAVENIPEGFEVDERGNPKIPQFEEWFYVALIEYTGVGGGNFISGFCWRYEPVNSVWIKHGEKYNYLT